jgi:ribulose 1,5-bisphosphate carboxylase large subunit-like protein
MPMKSALQAVYHVRSDARAIEERAHAIAVEQSVEMPITAIEDDFVLGEIVGRVLAIEEIDDGLFEVRIALAAETVGEDPGQLINMLFGNTSIHDEVVLHDVELPSELAARFGGPRHGLQAWRERAGAGRRALTCTALKPQGLPPDALGELALSRRAASITSRTITASPTRPFRRSRRAFARLRPRFAGRGRAKARHATCRACPAILTPCGRKSPSPRLPGSTPS